MATQKETRAHMSANWSRALSCVIRSSSRTLDNTQMQTWAQDVVAVEQQQTAGQCLSNRPLIIAHSPERPQSLDTRLSASGILIIFKFFFFFFRNKWLRVCNSFGFYRPHTPVLPMTWSPKTGQWEGGGSVHEAAGLMPHFEVLKEKNPLTTK